MRVLLLRRSARGGLAAWGDDLAARLPQHGFSVILDDAVWMPRETGPSVDREVSRRLRDLGDSFDLIHVFGYRAAWACAEAFGDDYFWMYSAYEPAPVHAALAKRLNKASLGFCASSLTLNSLSGQGVHSLDLVYPGVGHGSGPRIGREETRELLQIPKDAFVVGSFADEGLVDAFRTLPEDWGHLVLAEVEGSSETNSQNMHRVGWTPRPRDIMEAADVWVGPNNDRGYVRNVAEAMFEGVPVLVRDCMREMVEEDVSGFIFLGDDSLADRLREIRGMELTRQTVGAAGQIRAVHRFDIDQSASEIAQRYRDLVQEAL